MRNEGITKEYLKSIMDSVDDDYKNKKAVWEGTGAIAAEKSTFNSPVTGFIGPISKLNKTDKGNSFEVKFDDVAYEVGIKGNFKKWMKVGARVRVCFVLNTIELITKAD